MKDVEYLLGSRIHSTRTPTFKIKQVSGANSPVALSKFIKVDGWLPKKIEPHVSNVEALVRNLGGDKLYGSVDKHFFIVLRELIQNARDSIAARRQIDAEFQGEIAVTVFVRDGATWLHVDDDGVGMSERVLTGPLLDFGNSFWKSSLIAKEFPGLRASKFRAVGRFGIGFYSIFMVAGEAEVISRPWDKGLDETRTLVFHSGVSLRPVVRVGRVLGMPSKLSTSVRVRLNDDAIKTVNDLIVKSNYVGAKELHVNLSQYVAGLVVGLDVPVRVSSFGEASRLAHGGNPFVNPDGCTLLSNICFAEHQEAASDYVSRNHHRLRCVGEDINIPRYGVAALSTIANSGQMLLSTQTVGGLSASLTQRHNGAFVGYMEHSPDSAKRNPGAPECPPELLLVWAEKQMKILESHHLEDHERWIAGGYALEFGADSTDFSRLLVKNGSIDSFLTYHQVIHNLKSIDIVFLRPSEFTYMEDYGGNISQDLPGVLLIRPCAAGKANDLNLIDGAPGNLHSIAGRLHDLALKADLKPQWTVAPTRLSSRIGVMLELVTLTVRLRNGPALS